MKTWLRRVGKIARAQLPHRESPIFSPDPPLGEFQSAPKREKEHPVFSQTEIQYYANLELPVGTPFEEIKRQYRTLLQRYHPDRFATATPEKQAAAKGIATQLNAAYAYFQDKEGNG